MITSRRFAPRRPAGMTLAALIVTVPLALAGCGYVDDTETGVMGNATAAPAVSIGEPAGTVSNAVPSVTDGAADAAGTLALRTGGGMEVLVGSMAQIAAGEGLSVTVDTACGDLAAGPGGFTLACPDGVQLLSPQGAVDRTVGSGTAYSAAVALAEGRILAARDNSRRRDLFDASGELVDNVEVSSQADQLVYVPGMQEGDRVVEVNRSQTSVHGVTIRGNRVEAGAALRVGLGVGLAAAGTDGLLLTADATGSQLLVYTATDVLRLHQSRVVPTSPWAPLWDADREIAWVASTEGSVLTGWEISSGVPVQVAELTLVADVQTVLADGAGGLVAPSATGGGIQHLTAEDLDRAIAEYPQTPTTQEPS